MNTLQYRFAELRYDGDRTVSGVVLNYSDMAQLDSKGTKERFEPRAFGDLENEDIILNFQHDRTVPIARTGGGGLQIHDDGTQVTLSATLPNTRAADDALELIKNKVMRGFSIEFMPTKQRWDKRTRVVSKAQLKNIAIVDRPAYPQSIIDLRAQEELQMDKDEIAKLIRDELEKRDEANFNLTQVTRRITDQVETAMEKQIDQQVREQIKTALEERAEMEEKKREVEEENMEMKEEREKEKKMREVEMEEERKKMEMEAEDRAEIIANIRPLLPEDFETRGKSVQEILVAAVGDTVSEPEKRSQDYLQAKVETILEIREASEVQQRAQRKGATQKTAQGGLTINRSNVIDLLNTQRTQKRG